MGDLIEDLLRLSRIGRQSIKLQRIDLGAMATDIVSLLQEKNPGHPAVVTIADDLEVQGDLALLRVVLENLLENAFKFTRREPDARIELYRVDPDTLAVRDTGAGFDPTQTPRLFQPFQRLHVQSEYPGNGIGLATVRRIVERHGGSVRAEGQLRAGATFYFSLPTA